MTSFEIVLLIIISILLVVSITYFLAFSMQKLFKDPRANDIDIYGKDKKKKKRNL